MATKLKTVATTKTAPPAAKGPSTAVTVKPANAVVAGALAAEMAADSGKGMEGVDADSVAIPFIAILQANSPACDPDSGEYIPEAKQGMIMNTVTREIFDGKEGIHFVPCHYSRKWLKWNPREAGGGFKGEMMLEEVVAARESGVIVEEENRLYLTKPGVKGVDPEVNIKVADTRVHYILFLHPVLGPQRAVLSLASTQIKKSRQLIALLDGVRIDAGGGRMVTPPTFANVVELGTVPESNEKGKWYGARIELAGLVEDSPIYAMAKSFHALVTAGKAKVNFEAAAAAMGDVDAETVGGEADDDRGGPRQGASPAGRRASGGRF